MNVGDFVMLVKDLKFKGGLGMFKVGIKIKNIWFVVGDYLIDCKIDGVSYLLKLEFLKKV